ncbi:PAS domain S-box protein [candidate division KSB1 bacterium]|nr:PAS domain S-box protein [candidate division KSB1 bacterium]
MKNENKTNAQLIAELKKMRHRVSELEQTETARVQALRESEQRFMQIAENALEWIWEVDVNGLYTYVSPIVEKTLGYKPEEFVGKKHFYDLFHPKEREELKKAALGVFAQKLPFREFPNRNIHKTGKEVWLLTSGVPMLDEKGELIGYRGADTDITERKQAEETLAFEREQLLSIFDSIDEVVYVTDPDTYEILYVNQAIQDAFQKELIGGVCYREFQGLDSPCEFCTNEIILKQKPASHRWEYHNPALDRDFAIVDRIIKWPDGRDVRFELAIDITERKQAELALQESEARYRSLIEHSNDAIYLLYDRKFEIINKKFGQLLGYTLEEVNKPDFDFINLVASKSRPVIEDRTKRASRGEKLALKYEFTAVAKNGKELEVEASVSYISYKDGIATQGIIRDITERKNAEQQIQKDLQEKTILLSEIHHRVKNSLQVVVGLLQLQSRKIKDENILDLFNESKNRIYMMASVYEKLYHTENFSSIDFKEYLNDVLNKMYRFSGMSHRVSFKMDIKNIVLGLDDAIPVALILNELFTNSIKYAFPENKKGAIEISFNLLDEETYQLIYKDNGVGLPDNIDFSTTETLGLHLVKILAKQINGDSVFKPNGWTTFVIEFKGYGYVKKGINR